MTILLAEHDRNPFPFFEGLDDRKRLVDGDHVCFLRQQDPRKHKEASRFHRAGDPFKKRCQDEGFDVRNNNGKGLQ